MQVWISGSYQEGLCWLRILSVSLAQRLFLFAPRAPDDVLPRPATPGSLTRWHLILSDKVRKLEPLLKPGKVVTLPERSQHHEADFSKTNKSSTSRELSGCPTLSIIMLQRPEGTDGSGILEQRMWEAGCGRRARGNTPKTIMVISVVTGRWGMRWAGSGDTETDKGCYLRGILTSWGQQRAQDWNEAEIAPGLPPTDGSNSHECL